MLQQWIKSRMRAERRCGQSFRKRLGTSVHRASYAARCAGSSCQYGAGKSVCGLGSETGATLTGWLRVSR